MAARSAGGWKHPDGTSRNRRRERAGRLAVSPAALRARSNGSSARVHSERWQPLRTALAARVAAQPLLLAAMPAALGRRLRFCRPSYGFRLLRGLLRRWLLLRGEQRTFGWRGIVEPSARAGGRRNLDLQNSIIRWAQALVSSNLLRILSGTETTAASHRAEPIVQRAAAPRLPQRIERVAAHA